MAGVCERSGAYRVLVGKHGEKRHFGRPGRGWVVYTKQDVTETFGDVNCVDLDQMACSCERGDEPPVFIKYGEFLCLLRNY